MYEKSRIDLEAGIQFSFNPEKPTKKIMGPLTGSQAIWWRIDDMYTDGKILDLTPPFGISAEKWNVRNGSRKIFQIINEWKTSGVLLGPPLRVIWGSICWIVWFQESLIIAGKYYDYFFCKYPKCSFIVNNKSINIVGVLSSSGQVVGAITLFSIESDVLYKDKNKSEFVKTSFFWEAISRKGLEMEK